MILTYRYFESFPLIIASAENPLTRVSRCYKMLIDTGSCFTGFPGKYAAQLGLDNNHQSVKCQEVQGSGGAISAYVHVVHLGLIDTGTTVEAANPRAVWRSVRRRFLFFKDFDCGFGIIGLDTISQWKELRISAKERGGEVVITI